jgi:hypothetical protein
MKAIIIFLVASIVIIGIACEDNSSNKSVIKITDDSLEVVNDTITLKEFLCLMYIGSDYDTLFRRYREKYLIRSQFEFDTSLTNRCNDFNGYSDSTRDTILPKIDFTKYMLAGFRMSSTDKNVQIIKSVIKDYKKKEIRYHIDYITKWYDFKEDVAYFQSMNWLLIPQMPVNWTFICDTTMIYTK